MGDGIEGAGSKGSGWDSERVTLGKSFIRDMEGLWAGVLKLTAVVEEALVTSIRALCDDRADLAALVKGEERTVNNWEVQIERECLRVLALHQPVASDLRRVATALKINGDLERMGDLAFHIAKRVKKAAKDLDHPPLPEAMEAMATEVLAQVHETLDALTNSDVELARHVIQSDRATDRHYRAVLRELKNAIRQDPERLDGYFRLINSARNLERIADHATNIAEAVIYLRDGDIIRHAHSSQGLRT